MCTLQNQSICVVLKKLKYWGREMNILCSFDDDLSINFAFLRKEFIGEKNNEEF